jgi:hypothetical protein
MAKHFGRGNKQSGGNTKHTSCVNLKDLLPEISEGKDDKGHFAATEHPLTPKITSQR